MCHQEIAPMAVASAVQLVPLSSNDAAATETLALEWNSSKKERTH